MVVNFLSYLFHSLVSLSFNALVLLFKSVLATVGLFFILLMLPWWLYITQKQTDAAFKKFFMPQPIQKAHSAIS
jgi:hypothetical protein